MSAGAATPPRTAVVGVGAVGGVLAARLTEAGWPVAVVARGDTLAALRDGPLWLVDDGDERRVPLRAVADPREAGPVELALMCVKSFDTHAAALDLAPALAPGAVVLSLQNGVDNPGVIARACPSAAVGGVAVYLGVQRTSVDRVVRRPSRDPRTGALRDRLVGGGAGGPGEALAAVGEAAGIPVEVTERVDVALWTKLVANASLNTVTALGRARVGRVFGEPAASDLMRALGREVVAVAHAAGIPVADDAADAYVADARRRLPAEGGSSTLFDLEAGRRLERDALVGAVVREGRRLGVPVPVSEACDALLRLVDPGPTPERADHAAPRRRVAVVACMDARLDPWGVLGLARGDAHVIRNAGGVATDDVIRSLSVSQRRLGTEEIVILHHTDCGMTTFHDDDFRREIERETGIRPPWAAEAFTDHDAEVRQSIERIRRSPFIPRVDRVRGYVYDVRTANLREVTD